MANENYEIVHYGTPRHSGRYPWGSGQDPKQHTRDLLGTINGLRRQGMSDTEIAKGLGMTTTELRAKTAIAKNIQRKADATEALRLKDKGMSNVAIGQRMGINESSVRSLLNPAMAERRDVLQSTANLLKDRVGKDNYLDIGAGTENHLSISATKLSTAVAMLKEEGYQVINVQVDQLGTGNKTTIKVLAPKGTTYADVVRNPDKIKSVAAYSEDGGRTYKDVPPPKSISSNRVAVRYGKEGGAQADGVIYVRRGVDDVSLGAARYAQVRVKVDDTHYLKGMAMYNDNMPPGIDLLFNTNKNNTGNKLDALKTVKDDPTNPFGTITRPNSYMKNGKPVQGVLNIVNEEGNWRDWSRTLSSQFLSKQSTGLAKRQLDLSLQSRKDEFDEIKRLTNPVIKKKLLDTFADGADSAAVHLKAAALPRQGTHVILPMESMKESEVYAPNYRNGEKVALVRFPHGGTFEIPELTVNNKNPEAKSTLGSAIDAVGIHPKVAERLSGADFDGDTVLVIPNNKGEIKSSAPLSGLKDFDPKVSYPSYPGMKSMTSQVKQQQMGDVSNLITDMTIKGAKPDELARAVRHSMVVIDAEKHNLDWKRSYSENGIASLKEKYQGSSRGGASTVISRSSSQLRVPKRTPRSAAEGGPVDAATGEKRFTPTGESYVRTTVNKRTGLETQRTIVRKFVSTKMAETKDAHTLSSGTPIEEIYANHANSLKDLANQARKTSLETRGLIYSPTANKAFASEVSSLRAKLNTAVKNKPLERQAQLVANAAVKAKRQSNPDMDAATLKKVKGQELVNARIRVGAKKEQVEITPEEWQAVQSGAISNKMLSDILDNANLDRVKELATPRATLEMTPTKVSRAKLMLDAGYTRAEVADALGVAVSTLYASLDRGV